METFLFGWLHVFHLFDQNGDIPIWLASKIPVHLTKMETFLFGWLHMSKNLWPKWRHSYLVGTYYASFFDQNGDIPIWLASQFPESLTKMETFLFGWFFIPQTLWPKWRHSYLVGTYYSPIFDQNGDIPIWLASHIPVHLTKMETFLFGWLHMSQILWPKWRHSYLVDRKSVV